MMKKKYIFSYIAIIFMFLAFTTWFLRYFIYVPIFYSLNDFFWLGALILFIGQITNNIEHGDFLFFLFSITCTFGIIIEENLQNFSLIYSVGTFDILDIYAYIISFVFTVVLVIIIKHFIL